MRNCHTELNYKLERALKKTFYEFLTRSSTTPMLFTLAAFILLTEMVYIFTEMPLSPFEAWSGHPTAQKGLTLAFYAALVVFLISPFVFVIRLNRSRQRQDERQEVAVMYFILSSIVSLFSNDHHRLNHRINTLPGKPQLPLGRLKQLYRRALWRYIRVIFIMQLGYFAARGLLILASVEESAMEPAFRASGFWAGLSRLPELLYWEVGFAFFLCMLPVLILMFPLIVDPKRMVLP